MENILTKWIAMKTNYCLTVVVPLVLVTLEIINSDAVIRGDDFPDEAVCDLTIFDPNKSVNELIEPFDGLLQAANDVFHSDE